MTRVRSSSSEKRRPFFPAVVAVVVVGAVVTIVDSDARREGAGLAGIFPIKMPGTVDVEHGDDVERLAGTDVRPISQHTNINELLRAERAIGPTGRSGFSGAKLSRRLAAEKTRKQGDGGGTKTDTEPTRGE